MGLLLEGLVGLVVLLGAAVGWRAWRCRQWRNAPNYVEAIQAWAPERVLPALPKVRTVRARRVSRFELLRRTSARR